MALLSLLFMLWCGLDLVSSASTGQEQHLLHSQHASNTGSIVQDIQVSGSITRDGWASQGTTGGLPHISTSTPEQQPHKGSVHNRAGQDLTMSASAILDAQKQQAWDVPGKHRSLQQTKPGLSDDDFVVAIPGCISRLKVAQSTRAWRNDLHTAIVINDSRVASVLDEVATSKGDHKETYLMWPDEPRNPDAIVGMGEARAALAPILAHRLFMTDEKHKHDYKWMLYGDDDTLFFMDNLKRMLQDYDHTQPLMISDNIWYAHKHHNFEAPRCLPCHLKTPEAEAQLVNTTAARSGGYVPPWGCPYCTSDMACRWWEDKAKAIRQSAGQKIIASDAKPGARLLAGTSEVTLDASQEWQAAAGNGIDTGQQPDGIESVGRDLKAKSKVPPKACHHAVAHGGAGIIISRALFDRVDLEKFITCVQTHKGCAGGDCRFGVCMREVAGMGFTDPGHSVFSNNNHYKTVFDNEQTRVIKRSPSEALARGLCDEVCLWQIQNAVSTHIKARSHASFTRACAYMYAQVFSHQAAQTYLQFLAARHQMPAVLDQPSDAE